MAAKKPKVSKRSFTVPLNQQNIKTEIVTSETEDIIVQIPEGMSAIRAKKTMWWFAMNMYRFW